MRLVVVGAAGRMGQMLIKTIHETPGATLSGAIERPGSIALGQDAGLLAGIGETGVKITDDPLTVFAKADGVLDFTAPEATVGFAALAAQARIVHVVGTTGMAETTAKLEAAARHAVIVRSGNMSLGVNLLAALVKRVASTLGEDFDIEVLEMHHRMKVDAPSGTALLLGEAAAEGRGIALADRSVRGRDGHTGARKPGRHRLRHAARRHGRRRPQRRLRRRRRTHHAAAPCRGPRASSPAARSGRPVGQGPQARPLRHERRARPADLTADGCPAAKRLLRQSLT